MESGYRRLAAGVQHVAGVELLPTSLRCNYLAVRVEVAVLRLSAAYELDHLVCSQTDL